MSRSSDEKKFRLLMNQYGDCLYWHIRRIVICREDTEDAFQEMSIKIFRNLGSFEGDETGLKVWLYKIATNEALSSLRRKTHIFQSIDSLSPMLVTTLETENPADEGTMEMLLQKAILELPATQRLTFNLRYFDEMAYEQISAITGKSVGTLKTSYHYAAKRIEKYIKENIVL